MGRAIVRQPQVFLMDEPLSNLDAKLRVQMRADISKLQRDLGTTTIYVTHDQVEAMTMGDRVAVMNQGVLQQVDTPQRLYDQPANLFVAGFIGTPPMNLIEADVSVDGDAVDARGRRPAAAGAGRGAAALSRRSAAPTGGGVVVGLRAGDLHLARDRPDLPTLTARLELVEVLGSESIAYFRIDAMAIRPEGVDEETDDEMDGRGRDRGAARTSSRPSRPSRPTACESTPTSRSRSTPPSCTRSTRRRVRRSARSAATPGPLAAAAASRRCASANAATDLVFQKHTRLAARRPRARRSRRSRSRRRRTLDRLAADLLRHDRPLRERRPRERPRRAHRRRAASPASTRPTPAGSTAATSAG